MKEVTKKVAHGKKIAKMQKKNLANCPIQLKNCNVEPFCFLINRELLRREHTYLNNLKFPILSIPFNE